MSDVKVGDWVKYTGKSEHDLTSGKDYQIVHISSGCFDVLDNKCERNGWVSYDYTPVAKLQADNYTRVLEAMLSSEKVALAKRIAEALK